MIFDKTGFCLHINWGLWLAMLIVQLHPSAVCNYFSLIL
jgi:hypothetical protein